MPDAATLQASADEIAGMLLAGGMPVRLIGDGSVRVRSVAPLASASAEHLSFVRDEKYVRLWPESGSGVTLISERVLEHEAAAPLREATDRAVLAVHDADMALIVLLGHVRSMLPTSDPDEGVHPTAHVDPTATVGDGVRLGPFVCVGAGAHVGDHATLRAHAVLGTQARIGAHTTLMERVVIGDRCVVGSHSTLHMGVSVGADGFGYRPPTDTAGPFPIKIPHIGHVEIGDHVEIGANSCVDRATYGVTRIGDGTKLDNLVQVGHNATIGRGSLICGSAAIGGSARVGDGVILGGMVGIVDSIYVGNGAQIAAKSGVTRHVPDGEVWSGFPARRAPRHQRKLGATEWLADNLGDLRKVLRSQGYHG